MRSLHEFYLRERFVQTISRREMHGVAEFKGIPRSDPRRIPLNDTRGRVKGTSRQGPAGS